MEIFRKMKRTVKISESTLRKIVSESIQNALNDDANKVNDILINLMKSVRNADYQLDLLAKNGSMHDDRLKKVRNVVFGCLEVFRDNGCDMSVLFSGDDNEPKYTYGNDVNESQSGLEMKMPNSFSIEEIKQIVDMLKRNPVQEMWKPVDLGICKVQRVESNQMSGKCSLLSKNDDGTDNLYKMDANGVVLVQIERMPNTGWLDNNGFTFMAWK